MDSPSKNPQKPAAKEEAAPMAVNTIADFKKNMILVKNDLCNLTKPLPPALAILRTWMRWVTDG